MLHASGLAGRSSASKGRSVRRDHSGAACACVIMRSGASLRAIAGPAIPLSSSPARGLLSAGRGRGQSRDNRSWSKRDGTSNVLGGGALKPGGASMCLWSQQGGWLRSGAACVAGAEARGQQLRGPHMRMRAMSQHSDSALRKRGMRADEEAEDDEGVGPSAAGNEVLLSGADWYNSAENRRLVVSLLELAHQKKADALVDMSSAPPSSLKKDGSVRTKKKAKPPLANGNGCANDAKNQLSIEQHSNGHADIGVVNAHSTENSSKAAINSSSVNAKGVGRTEGKDRTKQESPIVALDALADIDELNRQFGEVCCAKRFQFYSSRFLFFT